MTVFEIFIWAMVFVMLIGNVKVSFFEDKPKLDKPTKAPEKTSRERLASTSFLTQAELKRRKQLKARISKTPKASNLIDSPLLSREEFDADEEEIALKRAIKDVERGKLSPWFKLTWQNLSCANNDTLRTLYINLADLRVLEIAEEKARAAYEASVSEVLAEQQMPSTEKAQQSEIDELTREIEEAYLKTLQEPQENLAEKVPVRHQGF
jgi:hypothetical protein